MMILAEEIEALGPRLTLGRLKEILGDLLQITELHDTGSVAADAAYNADKLNDLIAGGVSQISIPAGIYPCDSLVIEEKRVTITTAPLTGGASANGKARLFAKAELTDHFISVTGGDSGLSLIGMDIHGNKDNQILDVDNVRAYGVTTALRGSIVIDDSLLRYAKGNLLDIGAKRHSWIVKNHSVLLQAGGYGIKSVGCEDIYFENSECGETGKTAVHIDGAADALVNNLRLSNFDIYDGGQLDPGGAAALGDYDNIHFGQYAANTKLMFGESLNASRHGISYARGTASANYAAHFQIGVRFTANSVGAANTYSDVYTEVGSLSAIGNVHSPFQPIGETPQPKYLYEVSGDVLSDELVRVVAPQFGVPAAEYAGSYGTAVTNDVGKVIVG